MIISCPATPANPQNADASMPKQKLDVSEDWALNSLVQHTYTDVVVSSFPLGRPCDVICVEVRAWTEGEREQTLFGKTKTNPAVTRRYCCCLSHYELRHGRSSTSTPAPTLHETTPRPRPKESTRRAR